MNWIELLLILVFGLLAIIVIMSMAGLSVLAERKVCGALQGRLGPNRTTIPVIGSIPLLGRFLQRLGIFQLVADAAKFVFKEETVPGHVKKFYYNLAPVVVLIPALVPICVLPFSAYKDAATGLVSPVILANVDIGMLVILAVGSLGVYGTVLAGWAANSKYPFLGGIRASAQMVSYELAMGLAVIPIFLWANVPGSEAGLSLGSVVAFQENHWNFYLQPITTLIYLVALFAETNRSPFDMAESETDLVGGFHTEYGAFKFGMFFIGEYAHIVFGSALFVTLFFGGTNFLPEIFPFMEGWANPWPAGILGAVMSTLWLIMKTCCLIVFFIWVRWTLPRFRYDQVMSLGWKILLPLAIANLIFIMFLLAVLPQPTV